MGDATALSGCGRGKANVAIASKAKPSSAWARHNASRLSASACSRCQLAYVSITETLDGFASLAMTTRRYNAKS